MSEQDGTLASTKKRRRRQTEKQDSIQMPDHNDREAWRVYWKAQGQPWRTEPEIDMERQEYLTERRSVKPDIEKGIYPFKDIRLSRADVEWLLATHENGRGPIWNNEQALYERIGLDLRAADLRQLNLSHLPLTRMRGGLDQVERVLATAEQREMAATHLERSHASWNLS